MIEPISPEELPEAITITVTPEDVELGEKCHPCGCPAYLALTREYPQEWPKHWKIDRAWAVVRDHDANTYAIYENPRELSEAIDVFDEREPDLANRFPGKFTLKRTVYKRRYL